MTPSPDRLAEIARQAVTIGTDLIKTTRPQTVIEKADRDTFTDVDLRIEHEIRAYLAKITPEIGFIGEEGGADDQTADSDLHWSLDPVDGTANLVHGVPLCGVSLGLMQGDRAIVAAIALPYADLHYTAAHGRGAYVNGRPIRVSTTAEPSKAMVAIGDHATGEDSHEKNKQRIALTAALAAQVERIRMFGSAAHDLTWLAEGRIDAAVIMSNKTHDIAAGVLIAREAGAIALDSTGREHTSAATHTIAAAPSIAEPLLSLVQAGIGIEPSQLPNTAL
ncbi:myo-inositol-1(or 4)-monophosphatase [Saccharothrix coeruleofusca]|uniref:inositol monophosphatase family protein n=1 Tax=Saccharothrix coeruleofusca TaxID=33919 RepID=UPI0027DE57D1|nr:inositol monophosphatase family protein [Saccharothrix coeruleofusca]MBP2334164.1 myo-inositol-1(or 4)-monophosphatase [Saccharothrix coeruleofusca]